MRTCSYWGFIRTWIVFKEKLVYFLWESNVSFQAFKLVKKHYNLHKPQLRSGRESDLTLIAALACRDASIDEQTCRRYAWGWFASGRHTVVAKDGKACWRKKPWIWFRALFIQILDLLSRERRWKISSGRPEIIGRLCKQKRRTRRKEIYSNSRIKSKDFELFFLQIRKFLTAKEQSKIYVNWYKGFWRCWLSCCFSLIASGFFGNQNFCKLVNTFEISILMVSTLCYWLM